MKKPTIVDVMVVYSHTQAYSASDKRASATTPFDPNSTNTNYNDAYEYFLKICQRQGLSAVFATSDDIIGPGKVKAYWKYEKGWKKVCEPASSTFMFDKLSPTTKQKQDMRNMLFDSDDIASINSQRLYSIFFDKYKTHLNLSLFTVPTMEISDSSSVSDAIDSLRTLMVDQNKSQDYSDAFILKDRFGAGGQEIHAIDSKDPERAITKIINGNTYTSYVLQPFVKFDKGQEFENRTGHIDTRLIYLGDKLIQAYTRTAKKTNFLCNEHQGGSLSYIKLSEIPDKIRCLSEEVIGELDEKTALYALDYIISNSGTTYLLEGNCGPGIDWNLSKKNNEKQAKLFIRKIVNNISSKIEKAKEDKYQADILYQRNLDNDLPEVFSVLSERKEQESPALAT